MPQEFHVLRCYQCQTFQVHQVKKSKKWICKLCGEKQSIKKVYGQGSGYDCRQHVQKLNLLRAEAVNNEPEVEQEYQETDELQEDSRDIDIDVHAEIGSNKWSCYVDVDDNKEDNSDEDDYFTTNRRRFDDFSRESKKRRRCHKDQKWRTQESNGRARIEYLPDQSIDNSQEVCVRTGPQIDDGILPGKNSLCAVSKMAPASRKALYSPISYQKDSLMLDNGSPRLTNVWVEKNVESSAKQTSKIPTTEKVSNSKWGMFVDEQSSEESDSNETSVTSQQISETSQQNLVTSQQNLITSQQISVTSHSTSSKSHQEDIDDFQLFLEYEVEKRNEYLQFGQFQNKVTMATKQKAINLTFETNKETPSMTQQVSAGHFNDQSAKSRTQGYIDSEISVCSPGLKKLNMVNQIGNIGNYGNSSTGHSVNIVQDSLFNVGELNDSDFELEL